MRSSKFIFVASSVTTLTLLITGFGSISAVQATSNVQSPIVFGAAVSLTGKLAHEGQLTKEGYELCQAKVNALGGIPVRGGKALLNISYQDDTSKPDTAAQLVDQFNDKGIKLILSSYGSPNIEAQAAVVERNGQVMADSAGADNKIFQKGYKRTFAVLSPATEYAASIIKAIGQLARPKPKTIVFLSADDGFSKTVTEGGIAEAKKEGFTVLSTQYFPNGSSDVSSSLIKIQGLKPDVIIGSVHLVEGMAIIKQSHELGIKPAGFGESVAPPISDFAKTLGAQAENVLGSSQWTQTTLGADKYFGTAKDYAGDILAKYNHPANYLNAQASAACFALVFAVEHARSADANKVRDALASLNTMSFFGRIRFDATGQNIYKPMSVIQIQQGKVVTVWPTRLAEARMIWSKTTS